MTWRRALVPVVLCVLLWGAVPTGAEGTGARAATGGDCHPRAQAFTVPAGHRAVRFRVLALEPGRPCQGEGAVPVEGFSIRKGASTLFVSYRDAGGRTVADPLPLGSLTLAAGEYALCAAPASGAAVALAWELEPAP